MSEHAADRAPVLAYAGLGAVVFVALLVAGFGGTSFATGADVFPPGAGNLPGVLASGAAAAGWFAVIAARLRRSAGLGTATLAGLAAATGYLAVAFLAVLPVGVTYAGGVVTHLLLGWYALVAAGAGLVAGTLTVVLWRASVQGHRARWPWEHGDEDEQ